VRRREDLTSLVNLACKRYGQLDVLINNAGIGPISPLDDLRVEDWENMIDINIKGVLYGIAAALPVFRKQGFGHFVNTASTAGIAVYPNMAVYAGTKFAVRAISEGLRQEAGDKLRVTVISPGFVRTDLTESMTNLEMKARIRDSMNKMGAFARRHRPGHRVRNRAARRCGRGGNYCSSHGAKLVRGASRTGTGLTIQTTRRTQRGREVA
jgi:NADP-dependent 3-hydroxy acid dehydrogenase YdfG